MSAISSLLTALASTVVGAGKNCYLEPQALMASICLVHLTVTGNSHEGGLRLMSIMQQ